MAVEPGSEIVRSPISAGQYGLQLATLDDMFRFAQYVVASGMAPKGIDKPAAALVAIQMGMEVGLPPMASIQNIAVINGRPSIWGDAALAVVQQAPMFRDIEEGVDGDGDKAVGWCKIWKQGRENPIERRFSMSDAKAAGLAQKPGPWQQYPKRMLQLRARSWAMRDAFPGALRGLMVAEEAQDVPPEPKKIECVVEIPAKPGQNAMDRFLNEKAIEPEPVADPETGEIVDDDYSVDGPPMDGPPAGYEPLNTEAWRKRMLDLKAKKHCPDKLWAERLSNAGSMDGILENLTDEQVERFSILMEGK